jgi:glucose-1-phosphate thymidylyltransferase
MYPRETVSLFNKYLEEGNKPDAPGFFLEWLYKRKTIYGYPFNKPEEQWYDIGSIDQYEEANRVFAQKE